MFGVALYFYRFYKTQYIVNWYTQIFMLCIHEMYNEVIMCQTLLYDSTKTVMYYVDVETSRYTK